MKKAYKPEEIEKLFLGYVNSGDLDGIVSLFEDNAIVMTSPETVARGKIEIRDSFAKILADNPKFDSVSHRQPIVNGDIALTSTKLPNGFVTVEVARKQADGSWLWSIDQPVIAIEK